MTKEKTSKTIAILSELRNHYYSQSNRLDPQQASAHLSMAYTIKIAPLAFELMPWITPATTKHLPGTKEGPTFFNIYKDEVLEVMNQKLTYSWLERFVKPRFIMEDSIKCRGHDDFLNSIEDRYHYKFNRIYNSISNDVKKDILESNSYNLKDKYDALEKEKGLYARKKGEKADIEDELNRRGNEIFSKFNFQRNQIIATNELDGFLKSPCQTSWICICDYAVSQICWEETGIKRNKKISYVDSDGFRKEIDGEAFNLYVNQHYILTKLISKLSGSDYFSSKEAIEIYPEFVVRPDLLETRLSTIKKYFKRLNELPDYKEIIQNLYKDSENEVRTKHGVPLIRGRNEPVTVRPSATAGSGFTIPKPPQKSTTFHLDMGKIAALKAESEKVSSILGAIFVAEPVIEADSEELTADNGLGNVEQGVMGLDPVYSDLVKLLSSRTEWSRAELEEIIKDRGLMIDGALEHINEAAFDHAGMPFTEGDDPVEINQNLVKELYA